MRQLKAAHCTALYYIPIAAVRRPCHPWSGSSPPSLRGEFARWLYDIRCAVVRSKKTRRGATVSGFEPYTTASKSVSLGLEIVRWLAILCIEKDHDLTNPSHP